MSFRSAAALLCFVVVAPLGAAEPPPAPSPNAPLPTPAMSADECAVWNRERSFARSVEAHDAAAFKAHVHPHAVFFGGGPDEKLVGAEQVTEGWGGIIAEGPRTLRWYPRRVVIAEGSGVAHSVGFYWMQDTTPGAKRPYAIGQFNSIWTQVDGEWMVTFDGGGGGRPNPATKEEVDAILASLAKECPRA